MLTEDEAREKWCPFVGVARHERQDERCIASECMAWRSAGEMLDSRNGLPLGRPSGEGYCGLAGKP